MDAGSDPGIADRTGVADREVFATRLLQAPRELVFAAWTDTAHLGEWWGPAGFTTTTHDARFEPGGQWRFTMHGPDGTDYANVIDFVEVTRPERIVYRHRGEAETENIRFEVQVDFADEGGATRLAMRMRFPSNEARDFVIEKYGALEGLVETMARLRDHVALLQDAVGTTRAPGAPLAPGAS